MHEVNVKKLLKLMGASLFIGTSMFASPVLALALGVAGDYNAFIFGDFTSQGSDTEGRLAAGGNVTLTDYGIGAKLPGVSSIPSLVVGGSLSYTNGQVNKGNAIVGGAATTSRLTVANGTLSSNVAGSLPVDFTAAQRDLTSLSQSLSSTAANGTVAYSYGSIAITGDGRSALQIFNIDGSQLSSANSLVIADPNSIFSGATLVFNVSGSSDRLANMGMQALAGYAGTVLFNFYEATSLEMSGVAVEGSLLAPLASITANNGQINGTVIANSWNGGMELHNVPIPGAALLFSSGLIGLLAMRRLGRS